MTNEDPLSFLRKMGELAKSDKEFQAIQRGVKPGADELAYFYVYMKDNDRVPDDIDLQKVRAQLAVLAESSITEKTRDVINTAIQTVEINRGGSKK